MQQIDRSRVKEEGGTIGAAWSHGYLFLGLLLLVSWVGVRLVGLPWVGAAYLRELPAYYAMASEAIAAGPSAGRYLLGLTKILGGASIVAAGFIWLLSIIWFGEMVKVCLHFWPS